MSEPINLIYPVEQPRPADDPVVVIVSLRRRIEELPEWYRNRARDQINRMRGWVLAAELLHKQGDNEIAVKALLDHIEDDLAMIADRIADWTEEVGGYD